MSLRNRSGNWHYRFYAAGRSWTGDTGLVATARNKHAAMLAEAQARKLVAAGRSDELRLQVKAFSDAASQFVEWAQGEHRDKPQTWKRLRGSMTSLKEFFRTQPLHTITVGQVQDYMAWRRNGDEAREIAPVAEISLRHDLHALSPLFKYGVNHNWCSSNPVERVKIPSDMDAVRINVLSPAVEMAYFAAAKRYGRLHDLGRIMILQGPRPSEVMQARREHVDLERGTWSIPKSKSSAGKRTLKLTAEARSIFAARVAACPPSGWLFEGKTKGTHLHKMENSHKAVLEATGLAFVLYDLRHTFATRFYSATRDVVALKTVLGHSNLRTIMKYVHVDEQHVNSAMATYEATLTKPAVIEEGKERIN